MYNSIRTFAIGNSIRMFEKLYFVLLRVEVHLTIGFIVSIDYTHACSVFLQLVLNWYIAIRIEVNIISHTVLLQKSNLC